MKNYGFILLGIVIGMGLVWAHYKKKVGEDKSHIKNHLKSFLESDYAASLGIDPNKIYNQIYAETE